MKVKSIDKFLVEMWNKGDKTSMRDFNVKNYFDTIKDKTLDEKDFQNLLSRTLNSYPIEVGEIYEIDEKRYVFLGFLSLCYLICVSEEDFDKGCFDNICDMFDCYQVKKVGEKDKNTVQTYKIKGALFGNKFLLKLYSKADLEKEAMEYMNKPLIPWIKKKRPSKSKYDWLAVGLLIGCLVAGFMKSIVGWLLFAGLVGYAFYKNYKERKQKRRDSKFVF